MVEEEKLTPPEKKRLTRIRDYIKERRKESGRWKKGERKLHLMLFCLICPFDHTTVVLFGFVSLTSARSFR